MTRFLYVPVFLPSCMLVRLDRLTIALDRAINPYILSLIYSLIYRVSLWGARFLSLSYIGVVGGGEKVFYLSNRGAVALEESERLFIYTLLYSRRVYFFCPHIFHPLIIPILTPRCFPLSWYRKYWRCFHC